MAITESLLVAAPMLQDYIVDKDTGEALQGGIVSLFKDNARLTYKTWYYQTGTIGNYSYIPLDNPLVLSSVGTIQDPNGNDIIPFYYPYNEDNDNQVETYYITVYSANQDGSPAVLQFTRQNFPFTPNQTPPSDLTPTLRNYIVNNRFWRPAGTYSTSLRTYTYTVSTQTNVAIAPSQHDGFSMPDIRFIKDVADGTDVLTFTPFLSETTLNNDTKPEFFLNYECSGGGTSTVKYIQFPISLHLLTLADVENCLVTLQAINETGDPDNDLTISILRFDGTGTSTSETIELDGSPISTTNSWTKFPIGGFTMPTAEGITLGQGGDDAFYLRIGFPVGVTFDISIALPSFYLSTDAPDNDFDTYDQIDAVVNSSRTGDIRVSLNNFYPFGWVPLNNGTIGNADSSATTRASIDTWQLYNLLWGSVNNTFAPVSTGRGASAIADFNANKTITLTQALGRCLLGLPPSATFTYNHLTSLLTVADTTLFYVGAPVLLTNSGGGLPPAFTAGTVYYVIPNNATTFKLASSYANALAGTAVAAGASDGTGTQTVSFSLGGYFGEQRHTQLVGELAAHNHGLSSDAPQTGAASGGGSGSSTTSNAGSSNPFNVIQPSVYYNIFMKL